MSVNRSDTEILILAAGGSNRLGQAKQLLPLAGETLLIHTAQEAINSNAANVVIVLGARHKEIANSLSGLPVKVINNEDWEKGMGNSLKAGITSMKDAAGIIIAVCDQPFISSDVFNRLINEFEKGDHDIIAASYSGTVGTPALFGRAHFHELEKVPDNSGAKALLYRENISTIPFAGGSVDIDTKEDWEDYLKSG